MRIFKEIKKKMMEIKLYLFVCDEEDWFFNSIYIYFFKRFLSFILMIYIFNQNHNKYINNVLIRNIKEFFFS